MKGKVVRAMTAAILAAIALGGAVLADSSMLGPTGMVLNPTADITPIGKTDVQVTFASGEINIAGFGSVDASTFSIGGCGGIAKKGELSVTLTSRSVDTPVGFVGDYPLDDSGFGAGYKYQWATESLTKPAMALGVGFSTALEHRYVYLAITKRLNVSELPEGEALPIRGTIGARWDKYGVVDQFGAGYDEASLTVFGGGEAALSPKLSLIAEVGSAHDAMTHTPFSVTANYQLSDHLKLQAGAVNDGFNDTSAWIARLTYAWSNVTWR